MAALGMGYGVTSSTLLVLAGLTPAARLLGVAVDGMILLTSLRPVRDVRRGWRRLVDCVRRSRPDRHRGQLRCCGPEQDARSRDRPTRRRMGLSDQPGAAE